MRLHLTTLFAAALVPALANAQDGPFKIEPLKEAPPAAVAAPIKAALGEGGHRIVDGQGKPFADFWLRKAVPATAKPSGPKGAVLFPVLAEGELLGVVRYAGEGHDYRDQTIEPGVYTLRYGLQPVNGDHLGVSENRDYGLLVPSAKDATLAPLPRQKLETQSAEAAGSSHPAVLMMLAPPPDAPGTTPTLAHDETRNLWGVVMPLNLEVKGDPATSPLKAQLVVVGTAPQ